MSHRCVLKETNFVFKYFFLKKNILGIYRNIGRCHHTKIINMNRPKFKIQKKNHQHLHANKGQWLNEHVTYSY